MKLEYYSLFDVNDDSQFVNSFVKASKFQKKVSRRFNEQELLEAYVKKGREMIEALGIKPHSLDKLSINKKATSFWGITRIRRKARGSSELVFKIEISYILINEAWKQCENGKPEYCFEFRPLMNTVLHELLHCVDGCFDHGRKWSSLAYQVNQKYGYDIRRTTSADDEGFKFNMKDTYKYLIECPICHNVIGRNSLTKPIKFPNLYCCGPCQKKGIHSNFVRIK